MNTDKPIYNDIHRYINTYTITVTYTLKKKERAKYKRLSGHRE